MARVDQEPLRVRIDWRGLPHRRRVYDERELIDAADQHVLIKRLPWYRFMAITPPLVGGAE